MEERFLFESQTVIGFAITALRDWPKTISRHLFSNQKQMQTSRNSLAHVFARFELRQVHVITSSLIGSLHVSVSFVIC